MRNGASPSLRDLLLEALAIGIEYARMPRGSANAGVSREQSAHERAELRALHAVRTGVECGDRAKPLDVAHEVPLDRAGQVLGVALELRARPLALPVARVQENGHGDREREPERHADRDPPRPPGVSRLAEPHEQERREDQHADRVPDPPREPVVRSGIGRNHTGRRSASRRRTRRSRCRRPDRRAAGSGSHRSRARAGREIRPRGGSGRRRSAPGAQRRTRSSPPR